MTSGSERDLQVVTENVVSLRDGRIGNQLFVLSLGTNDYIIEFSTDNIEIFLVQWSPVSGGALFVFMFDDAQATGLIFMCFVFI